MVNSLIFSTVARPAMPATRYPDFLSTFVIKCPELALASDCVAFPVSDTGAQIDDFRPLINSPFPLFFPLFFPYSRAIAPSVFAFLAPEILYQIFPFFIHKFVDRIFANMFLLILPVPSSGYLFGRPILFQLFNNISPQRFVVFYFFKSFVGINSSFLVFQFCWSGKYLPALFLFLFSSREIAEGSLCSNRAMSFCLCPARFNAYISFLWSDVICFAMLLSTF